MERWIAVLMAVNDQYAGPLYVAVQSLLNNLRPRVGVDLYLMDSDFTHTTRRKLEDAWDERIRIHWIVMDARTLESVRPFGYRSPPASNFRLLMGSCLPGHVRKVIYLDADVLVRKDVCEIWDQNMQGAIVLAVQDSYMQCLPPMCRPADGERNSCRPYFNSGVMVVDLDLWRRSEVEQRCLRTAKGLHRRARWLDQDVLNACLAGGWMPLHPAWNRQYALNLFPDWQCSPYEENEFQEAVRSPGIIHFCSKTKPWHPFCDHPKEDVLAYRHILATAPFAAPQTEISFLRQHFEWAYAPHRRLLDVVAAAFRARRRYHAGRVMLPQALKVAVLHPWTLASVPLSVIRQQASLSRRS